MSIKLTRPIKPQAALVLDYLLTGRDLTHMVATVSLGVVSVSSRISELRAAGVAIEKTVHEDHLGKRYVKYRLRDG